MSAELNVTHFTAEIHQVLSFTLSSETLKFDNSHLMAEIHQAKESIRFLTYTIRDFDRTFNKRIVNFL